MQHVSTRLTVLLVVAGIGAAPAGAQWDPPNGQWGKSDPADLRIMTWNVKDGICSTNTKQEGLNNWTALARIVAAMKPDILLLQEAGDNSGNGTGSGGDSVADLTTTLDLFLHGGSDPFNGGEPVTAYVQAYDPDLDLPYIFVSTQTDGFNRNVILSRFPFTDLNGDTRSTMSDIPFVIEDEYAPGGRGGIRGFAFAEIDLDDSLYGGECVVGNAHLKAGNSGQDRADRLEASQNVAYVIDFWFNGAGTGIPDPHDKIVDNPPATNILPDDTPVLIGGDWNEDELTNGRRGPAAWLTEAEFTGGTDGTDRDRSDMTYDDARHVFTNDRDTVSSSKFDYLAWQDSIASLRRAFIFNTSGTPDSALPPEILDFQFPRGASSIASDHLPVIADLVLPPPAGGVTGDFDGDGDVDIVDFSTFAACFSGSGAPPPPGCEMADLDGDGDVDIVDFSTFAAAFTGSQ